MPMITLANPGDAMFFDIGTLLSTGKGRPLAVCRFGGVDYAAGVLTSEAATSFEIKRSRDGKRYIGATRYSYPGMARKRMFREMGWR